MKNVIKKCIRRKGKQEKRKMTTITAIIIDDEELAREKSKNVYSMNFVLRLRWLEQVRMLKKLGHLIEDKKPESCFFGY